MHEKAVQQYRLGSSDLSVSPIGLGCWQFSQGKGMVGSYWATLPQETVDEIVRTSVEHGVTWFDTAEVYGRGASERSLATALDKLAVEPNSYAIADKWWPALRFAGSIGRTFHKREQALGGRRIDLHQIHQPFSLSSVERQAEEMGRLVRAGKVAAVGVSNFGEQAMRRAHARLAADGIPLATNQVKWSLIDRDIERNGVLEAARELGVSIIAYSPLAQGVLTGKFHTDVDIRRSPGPRKWMKRFKAEGLAATRPLIDELSRIASDHGVSSGQIALAWTVQRHGHQIVAIPGASSVRHAVANADVMSIRLTTEELDTLDELGREAENKLNEH